MRLVGALNAFAGNVFVDDVDPKRRAAAFADSFDQPGERTHVSRNKGGMRGRQRRRHGQRNRRRHGRSDSRSTGKARLAIGNPVFVTHGRTLGYAGMAAMATSLTWLAEIGSVAGTAKPE